jgi:hypothetical protein
MVAIFRGGGVPNLERGLCVGCDPRVFDGTAREDIDKAIAICKACPCLAECGEFAKRRKGRLTGVWAGRVRGRSIIEDDENQSEARR